MARTFGLGVRVKTRTTRVCPGDAIAMKYGALKGQLVATAALLAQLSGGES